MITYSILKVWWTKFDPINPDSYGHQKDKWHESHDREEINVVQSVLFNKPAGYRFNLNENTCTKLKLYKHISQ